MERHETTTQTGAKPSPPALAALVRSAGWLAVLLMIVLSSPGVRVERVAEAPPVARAAPPPGVP